MNNVVMKFGGTSIQDANAMRRAARIVFHQLQRSSEKPLIVLSALAGITNTLADTTELAVTGQSRSVARLMSEIAERHFGASDELLENSQRRKSVIGFIRCALREIRELFESISVLQEVTPRAYDRILGYGELMSSFLFHAYLEKCGIDSIWIDARNVLITDDHFGNAAPLLEISGARAGETLAPLLQGRCIPVTQGFIGGTLNRLPTTLGRGTSDDSACIFGNLLNAAEVQIWTDVCGFMTADPKHAPHAQTISHLSFSEAARLSAAGAKVLHLSAIRWAEAKGIPIRIRNTFQPDHPGTLICDTGICRGAIYRARSEAILT